jgi:hypothetical protein
MGDTVPVRGIDKEGWCADVVWRKKTRSENIDGIWKPRPYLVQSKLRHSQAFRSDEDRAAIETVKIIKEMMK